jgi:hypothetical protein
MASLISFLAAWETTAKLLERFSEAYIAWKIQSIRSDHNSIGEARHELIKQIVFARASRDAVKLINLNKLLYIVEYNVKLQQPENKSTKS